MLIANLLLAAVPLIIDTDMSGDYDDVGALAVANVLADRGECEIRGVIASHPFFNCAPICEILMRHYGRGDVPIGALRRPLTRIGTWAKVKWSEIVPEEYPHPRFRTNADAPDGVEVYKSILRSSEDHSVVVCTLGHLTVFADLLRDKEGLRLVKAKVKRLVSMAGHTRRGREWNVLCDAESARYAFENCPVEVVYSPFEVGDVVRTGRRMIDSLGTGPVKRAYEIALPQGKLDYPKGRNSWDQTAVYYAIRGEDGLFATEHGTFEVLAGGTNTWTSCANGRDRMMSLKVKPDEAACVIEDLMMTPPKCAAVELRWRDKDGKIQTRAVSCGEKTEGVRRLHLTKAELKAFGTRQLSLTPWFARAEKGERGFWVLPDGKYGQFDCNEGGVWCEEPPMSFCGISTPRGAFVTLVTSLKYYAFFDTVANGGRYEQCCRLRDELVTDPYEDCEVEYHELPADATYARMAKFYRDYQLARGAVRPIKERIIGNEVLASAVTAPEIRIRQAWKPVPSPVLDQTPRSEPPVKAVVTFDRVGDIVDALKASGVGKAELCLVGWNVGGHDGRWPQAFPVEPNLGGEEALRRLIAKTQRAGYLIVPHGNFRDAYRIAENWDAEWTVKNDDGSIRRAHPQSWGGGCPFEICPQRAYEKFATRDIPEIAALGFRGIGYFDTVTILKAPLCGDARHPCSRGDSARYWGMCAEIVREKFGGFASEGPLDHFMGTNDSVLYAFFGDPRNQENGFVKRIVPIWQLVYNGIVVNNPFTTTVNFTAQDRYSFLKLLEFGGRPNFYFYSKFVNDGSDWMGESDLRCGTAEELARSVAKIKEGWDVWAPLAHLQLEYMTNHEQVAENVFRTTWADGTTLTVDYGKGTYEVANGERRGTDTVRLRPPSVPLVTVDPFFSVWSPADSLTDADTVHWSDKPQPVSITAEIDGTTYRLLGSEPRSLPPLPQVGLEVRPTTTAATFRKDGRELELSFITPKLTDDLEAFSRPVTYVSIRGELAEHAKVACSVSPALATNDDAAEMATNRLSVAGLLAVKIGRKDQAALSASGDRVRCNWGWVWCVGPRVADGETRFMLAYDDVKSISFLGKPLDAWWRRGGTEFVRMLETADAAYPELRTKCEAFDVAFTADMIAVGGVRYASLAALAYRQSFAACKLVSDGAYMPLYFSKENASNGCIGTVDVFYPQFPLLLLTSKTLARATLEPILRYAQSEAWPYDYAPHDLGRYPLADGQAYHMGQKKDGSFYTDADRMPVEECGNMILCLASLSRAEGNADYVSRWWPTVTKWIEYLERQGFDPGNQLCTDDFAGHLAHNANLSIKSIMAIAAYGMMANLRGEKDIAAKYGRLAKDMVPKWIAAAKGGKAGGYRLAFDRPGSWSQKYNLVWDRLLGLNLFPPKVASSEMAAYRAVAKPYGLPLDNRKTYAKADWSMWTATLTGRKNDFDFIVDGLFRFADETPDRVPLSDWYWTDSGKHQVFQARSVIGGLFIPALYRPDVVKRWFKD